MRLKSQLVLECDCVRSDQVQAVDLGKKVLFAERGVLLVTFIYVYPDKASKILGRESELCPVFAAIIVALVGGGTSETQCETDDESEDGKQKLVDTDWRWSVHVGC